MEPEFETRQWQTESPWGCQARTRHGSLGGLAKGNMRGCQAGRDHVKSTPQPAQGRCEPPGVADRWGRRRNSGHGHGKGERRVRSVEGTRSGHRVLGRRRHGLDLSLGVLGTQWCVLHKPISISSSFSKSTLASVVVLDCPDCFNRIHSPSCL